MIGALANHLPDDCAAADHGGQVGNQLANLIASLQRLGAQFVDLGTDRIDSSTQFGVLGTEVVEFLGRHRDKDTPEMCNRDRSPEQRP